MAAETGSRPRVGLFVTCLVDLIRPKIGFIDARGTSELVVHPAGLIFQSKINALTHNW